MYALCSFFPLCIRAAPASICIIHAGAGIEMGVLGLCILCPSDLRGWTPLFRKCPFLGWLDAMRLVSHHKDGVCHHMRDLSLDAYRELCDFQGVRGLPPLHPHSTCCSCSQRGCWFDRHWHRVLGDPALGIGWEISPVGKQREEM